MKLRDCPILADLNIDVGLIAFLRSQGFDVVSVGDLGLAGTDDDGILQRASTEQRAVLTHDSDFGALAVRSRALFFGIVYLRPGHLTLASSIDSLQRLLDDDPDLHPPFIVVVKRTKNRVTIRSRTVTP